MSDIIIRDANNVSQVIRTFSDATSVHNNASVPINVSGLPIFVTAAPGIVAGVVSVTPEGGNFPVSVAGQVSLAPQTLVVSGLVSIHQNTALFAQIQGQYLAAPPTLAAGAVSTAQLDVNGNQKVVPGNPFVVSIGAPLPAGTNHLGKVSVEGLTVGAGSGLTVSVGGAVSAQAVPMAGSDGSNYRIPLTDTGGRLIVNASLGGSTAHIGRVSVVPDGTGANFPVSLAPMAYNLPVSVHPVTQSGTWTVQPGNTANTTPWLVSVNSFIKVHVCNAQAAPSSDVSISPTQANIPVSVAQGRVSISGLVSVWPANTIVPDTDAKVLQGFQADHVLATNYVYNRGSNTWDRMTGTSVGVDAVIKARYSSTLPTLADGAVSVLQVGSRGSLNVTLAAPDSTGTIGLTNSMADAKANNINRIPTEDYMMVYNTSGGNWDRWDGKVSIGAIAVSVPPISGGTQLVSVGGATSVQAVQIAARDIGGNARIPLTHTDGALLVHVCAGSTGGAGGGGPTVSVGGPVSVQAVPVAGEDINGIVRLLKTAIDGTLKTSGYIVTPSDSFTRPTDTVAYSTGDLIANSTVAGAVIPLSWPVARLTNAINTLSIRKARIRKSGLNITNCGVRIHIFTTATGVSVSTGDNRVFTSVWSPVSKYAGAIDIVLDRPGADGSFGEGVPTGGNDINIVLTSGKTSISGLLEMRGAYTPLSGETFTVDLEIFQD